MKHAPPRSSTDGSLPRSPPAGVRQVAADYFTLTKPKVQLLLLLTTITTMYVAGDPSLGLVAVAVIGGFRQRGRRGCVQPLV